MTSDQLLCFTVGGTAIFFLVRVLILNIQSSYTCNESGFLVYQSFYKIDLYAFLYIFGNCQQK